MYIVAIQHESCEATVMLHLTQTRVHNAPHTTSHGSYYLQNQLIVHWPRHQRHLSGHNDNYVSFMSIYKSLMG